MKTFVRIGALVLALGAAGLLAGCASYRNNVVQRARPASDFEVVETSTKRMLNPKEMAVLKAKVADYLAKEGATARGNYYVKVFLAPDQDGNSSEWVIVRFSRDMEMRFELLGSDDTYYEGYGSYASYDYYPAGYDNFGRLSFQYYDDPYYGSRYYFPPRRNDHDRNHDHDHDHGRGREGDHTGDRDHDRDHDRNHDQDHPRTQDHAAFKPIPPVGTPQVTRTRWDGDSSGQNNNPRRDNNSSPDNNPPRERNFPHHGGAPVRSQTEQSTYTPPIRTSSQSAPQDGQSRSEPARQEPSSRTSSQSAPSYNPPAARPQSSNAEPAPRRENWSSEKRNKSNSE